MAPIGSKALKPRVRKIRRIVTGHDAKARSVIVSDAPSPHVMTLQGIPTFGVTEIWSTDAAPADNRKAQDPCRLPVQLAPPKRGTVVRVVEFPPDKAWVKSADREKAFASMGKSGAKALAHDASASRHPMMHRTQSIDYAIVLAGEIWALMDVGETKMKAGDILVQRGTNHAWSNRSRKPCLVAFVLIDAKPLK
ncbi:MAG TPA: cupin domain-containing protein [Candidatus Binataceae bacterium]|nr:cupin domain-containing protein [Candidatus Binataceae bacterium]